MHDCTDEEDLTPDQEAFYKWLLDPNGATMKFATLWPSLGIWTAVHQKLFHWSICMGYIGDKQSIEDTWCYETLPQVLGAWADWNPNEKDEPFGWHRHPKTARRRPKGNPDEEYLER